MFISLTCKIMVCCLRDARTTRWFHQTQSKKQTIYFERKISPFVFICLGFFIVYFLTINSVKSTGKSVMLILILSTEANPIHVAIKKKKSRYKVRLLVSQCWFQSMSSSSAYTNIPYWWDVCMGMQQSMGQNAKANRHTECTRIDTYSKESWWR